MQTHRELDRFASGPRRGNDNDTPSGRLRRHVRIVVGREITIARSTHSSI
jgi:hypothetical protein